MLYCFASDGDLSSKYAVFSASTSNVNTIFGRNVPIIYFVQFLLLDVVATTVLPPSTNTIHFSSECNEMNSFASDYPFHRSLYIEIEQFIHFL